MDDKRLSRALTWVGSGGTVMAVSALVTAGLFATTPDPASSASQVIPCAAAGCDSTTTQPPPKPAAVSHAGRVTFPGPRGVNQEAAAPAFPPTPAPAPKAQPKPVPKPVVWTTSLPAQHLEAPVVAMTPVKNGSLLMAGSDGGVFSVGQASFFGSLSGKPLSQAVTAVAGDPATGGYWLVGRDGGVFAFNAAYHGSLSGAHLQSPVVAMAATPTGNGYWLVSADGGVFAFGDAPYKWALSGHHLQSPVVAMAATPTGKGYWLVSADGGVFAFGDARYAGSLSGHHLQSPVVAMAATPTGRGYWLVSADGGVFAFGDAVYRGSGSGTALAAPVTAIVATRSGKGYWLAARNGRVMAFGDARPVQETAPPAQAVATATFHPGPVVHPAAHPAAHPAGHPAPPGPGVRAASLHADGTRREDPQGPAPLIGHGAYTPRATGYDISQYQCGRIPAASTGIAVVQVTGGALNNPPNPCYVPEARWAGGNMAAYIYMDGLPSPTPTESLTGPAGRCAVTNIACASYNYGYNWARYWVAYSHNVGVYPDTWWLDVERYSGWQAVVSNRLVVQGALTGLKSMHVSSGIYSTTTQWQEITGGMRVPGEAEWTPGAGNLSGPGYSATSFCAAPGAYTFGGGRLKMVQYGYQGPFPGSYSGPTAYDLDLAC